MNTSQQTITGQSPLAFSIGVTSLIPQLSNLTVGDPNHKYAEVDTVVLNATTEKITGLGASQLVGTDASSNLVAVTSSANPSFTNITATGTGTVASLNISMGAGTTISTTAPGSAQTITIPTGSASSATMILDTSTNTMTNKTLTTPTINGAALSGTFSGAPTFSGIITATGGITGNRTIGTNITGNYTLVITDGNQFILCTSASATLVTIPLNATVAFPLGTEIDFVQDGAGQVSFAITATGTLKSVNSLVKIGNQYTSATIKKTGTDTWYLVGNLSA